MGAGGVGFHPDEPEMRVAFLGIFHETNTFISVPADYMAFQAEGGHNQAFTIRGREVVAQFEASNHTVAGLLDAERELGFTLEPLCTPPPARSAPSRRTRTTA
eukprot:COSAG04_NODE_1155_length_8051_cov_12.928949_3_plen_103_part_00